MRIGGIFEPNALIGHYMVGSGFFLSHFLNPLPIGVLLRTKTGAGRDVQRGQQRHSTPYPNVGVQTGHSTSLAGGNSVNKLLGSSTPSSPWPCSSP
jgi:hypothetical protein